MVQSNETKPPRLAYSIHEFAFMAGISRTRVFEELKLGRLKAKKVGRRTIIPFAEAERWFEALHARKVG